MTISARIVRNGAQASDDVVLRLSRPDAVNLLAILAGCVTGLGYVRDTSDGVIRAVSTAMFGTASRYFYMPQYREARKQVSGYVIVDGRGDRFNG